jgi:hypothetical protein
MRCVVPDIRNLFHYQKSGSLIASIAQTSTPNITTAGHNKFNSCPLKLTSWGVHHIALGTECTSNRGVRLCSIVYAVGCSPRHMFASALIDIVTALSVILYAMLIKHSDFTGSLPVRVPYKMCMYVMYIYVIWDRGNVVGRGTMLLAGRLRVRIPMSLDFF